MQLCLDVESCEEMVSLSYGYNFLHVLFPAPARLLKRPYILILSIKINNGTSLQIFDFEKYDKSQNEVVFGKHHFQFI